MGPLALLALVGIAGAVFMVGNDDDDTTDDASIYESPPDSVPAEGSTIVVPETGGISGTDGDDIFTHATEDAFYEDVVVEALDGNDTITSYDYVPGEDEAALDNERAFLRRHH